MGLSRIFAAGLMVLPVAIAGAQDTFRQSWDGGSFSYPVGQPEITSQTLTLDGSKPIPFHCHPVPTMAHVLHGELEVETRSGQSKVFRQGDSLVEVMGTIHRGTVLAAPVELIVFYAGAAGTPITVLADDDSAASYCES